MLGNSVENDYVCWVVQQRGVSIAVAVQFAALLQCANIAAFLQLYGLIEKLLHCNKLTRDDRGAGSAGSPGQPRTGCCTGPNYRQETGDFRFAWLKSECSSARLVVEMYFFLKVEVLSDVLEKLFVDLNIFLFCFFITIHLCSCLIILTS